MSLRLFFYGGAGDYLNGELGGVQLLIEDMDLETKIMVDCGQRPDHYNQYYGFPYRPKTFQALDTSDILQLYPDLVNLFRHDYEAHRGKNLGPPPLDGIIITHAHYDHAGGLSLVRHDQPVWMHQLAKQILWVWQHTSGRTLNQFVDLYEHLSQIPNKKGEPDFASGEISKFPRDIRLFTENQPFQTGNMEIIPHLIDHSLPGSCGFIFKTSVGNIGLSGDIKLRGRRRNDTESFVQSLLEHQVKYLLWEGSLLHFDHEGTEDDVTEKIYQLIKDRSFAAIAYPPRDFDRLFSVYQAAKKDQRMLVISPAQALGLKQLDGVNGYPKLNWKYVGVYLHRKNKGLLDKENHSQEKVEKDYFQWERQFLTYQRWDDHQSKPQRVSIEDIKEHQDKFLVYMPQNYMIDMLTEISDKTTDQIKNGIYIRSHPGPWTKDMEVQEDQQINILKQFGMYDGPQPDYLTPSILRRLHQVHITGHLNRKETRNILRQFNCTIIPYHCMFPQDFVKDVASHTDVIVPLNRKEIMIYNSTN